jgi:hypothetical protein
MVSLKTAEKAWDDLRFALRGEVPDVSMAFPPTAEVVNLVYRTAAKTAHPHLGGSAEEFARIDRAKHALIHWLERSQPRAIPDFPRCTVCEGSGRRQLRRGFATLSAFCGACGGTGDAGYDPDRPDVG